MQNKNPKHTLTLTGRTEIALKGIWLEFHPLPFSYPDTQSPQTGEKNPIVYKPLKQ